ncbi:MAG: NAD(P)H-dependent glycerol-3-phosphate dehydrogenase [Oscillospiraceae bacterium]|jgi:glycerol-3-phosphate dehydrogenase (NAD(P)+)
MRIVVLGSGSWGSALAVMLCGMEHSVTLWSAFREEAVALNETREAPYLKAVRYPDSLEITDDISVCRQAQAVIVATPSFAIRETARKLSSNIKPGAILISASKGIENKTSLRLSEIISQETGGSNPIVAISGPSHAEEVSIGVPTGCVSACSDIRYAEMVQDMLMNPAFRVYASDDIVGVELGGALKNVIALSCGICDGMGFGDNTRAMLMTRGLTEMARLGMSLGGRKETFAGLAGVGDLIVTCTSMHSRNRRAGILIGQGRTAEEAMKEVGATVEGYYAAASAMEMASKAGVEMPISAECYKVLYEGKSPEKAIRELMTRSKKSEIEESWL